LNKSLKVTAHKFSATAKAAIEAAGGSAIEISE
jgi:ribosomal protein L18E